MIYTREDKYLRWAGYILFVIVAIVIGLMVAYFNGYITTWPWQQAAPKSMYEAAVAEFQTAIELEPGNPEGYRWLSKAYLLAGKTAEAENTYQQAVANNPDQAWPLVDLGQFYQDQARVEEAIATFQQAIELEPDYAPAYTQLAEIYRQPEYALEPEALTAFYQNAIEANPDQAWPYLELGNAYLTEEDVAQAEAAYRQALEVEPANPELHFKVGEIYRWQLNRLDEAVPYYRQVTVLAPDSAWAHAELGEVLYAAGQPEEGRQEFDLALSLGADESLVQEIVGETLFQYQSPEAAEPHLQEAIRLDPQNAQAQLELARLYRQQGDYGRALEHARSSGAVAQDGETVGAAYLEQGYIYEAQQKNNEALAQFSLALEAAPDNPWYQAQVGNFQMNQLDQPDQAIAYYRRAVALAPYNFWYHTFLGQALLATGQQAEGFQALAEALALAEDDARIYLLFGRFLEKREAWDLVVQIYEQALAEGIVDQAEIYQGLGEAYQALDNHPKALVNYRLAANLAPNEPEEQ